MRRNDARSAAYPAANAAARRCLREGGLSQKGPAGGRPVQGEAAAEESAPEITPQTVWSEFVRAKRFNEAIGLYDTVEKNEHFYIGDQWHGVNAPDLDQPVMNMLSRVVKYL